jgi:hypothetical protein
LAEQGAAADRAGNDGRSGLKPTHPARLLSVAFGGLGFRMTSDRIRIRCESCQKVVSFPAHQAGTTQECGACGQYIDVPDSSTDIYDPNREAQKYHDQTSEFDRQQKVAKEQLEQYHRQLDDWEEVLQKKQLEGERAMALIDRWNAIAERFEKLLDRWEKEKR